MSLYPDSQSAPGHSHATRHKREFNGRGVGVESLKQLGLEHLTSAHLILKTQPCENTARTLSTGLEGTQASEGPLNYASFESFTREPV